MQHAAAPRWAPPRRGGCLAVVGVLLAALPWPGRPLALVVGRPLPTVAPRGLSRSVARAAQGRAPMRCPGWPNCGCDGQGHLVGPLGKFMENSPIKVGAVWGTEEAQHSFRPARRRAGSRFWFREDPGPSKTDPG
ncbi:unnamed protein product [Prorocentrum cordatum]|uniref:Subtilisin n=1 Tax=Prorocentrum cordatum TaxID=2364126 RepID=A0ABN9QHU6_9DINO|nr:unnamed protein product [Polarella glacialis]